MAMDPSKLTPEQLQKLMMGPSSPPPPGVLPNFVNPENEGPMALGLSLAIMVVMFGFVGARMYSKAALSKTFGAEDWMCVVATIFTVAYSGMNFAALNNGAIGKHAWDVRLGQLDRRFFQELIATQSIYPITLLTVKLSLFILIARVFRPNKATQVLVWAGAAVTTLFYIVTFIITLVGCAPKPGGDPMLSASAPSCQTMVQRMSIVQAGFNIGSDLYLLLLPVPVVAKLQMPTQRKFGILLIFATGLCASILSVLVLYYRLQVSGSPDATWGDIPVIITSVWEVNVGVIVSCMPCLPVLLGKPGFKQLFSLRAWSRLTSLRSRSKRSSHKDSQSSTSYNVSKKPSSGSFEQIISVNGRGSEDVELGNYAATHVSTERNKYETGRK